MTREERRNIVMQRVQDLAKLDPFVPMTLQGTTYKLEFNNKAIKAVNAELGVNLLAEGFIPVELLTHPDKLCALVCIGLQKHHPDITEETVDNILGLKHQGYIVQCLREALVSFFPDVSDLPRINTETGELVPEAGGPAPEPPM